MEIAAADVDDVPAVVECWLALADEQRQYGSHVESEANRRLVGEELARHASTGRLFVAREDGLVGFVMVAIERGTYQKAVDRGVVEAIYVVPERRGEGIGSALLERAERDLVERGAERVTLQMVAGNDAARRFYRRHGYDRHRVELEKPVESDNHSKEGE